MKQTLVTIGPLATASGYPLHRCEYAARKGRVTVACRVGRLRLFDLTTAIDELRACLGVSGGALPPSEHYAALAD